MIKNEAAKATLEAKGWEGELDDADLKAVSGGGAVQDTQALGSSVKGSAQEFAGSTSSGAQTLAGESIEAGGLIVIAVRDFAY